jgi:hypothetical protein
MTPRGPRSTSCEALFIGVANWKPSLTRESGMDSEKPSDLPAAGERQGGKPLGDAEADEKGPWAARADEGIVPAELGQSDAEPEAPDGGLGDSVVGETTGSDEPATEDGVDLRGGDNADATTDGGPSSAPGVEPDLRDAASGPRESDVRSADDVHRTAPADE